jgi:hypothetical protein
VSGSHGANQIVTVRDVSVRHIAVVFGMTA